MRRIRRKSTRRAAGKSLLAVLALLLLGGCATSATTGRSTASVDLVAHKGFDGVWLKNAHAEAFVAVRPHVRLLVLRRPGGESMLRVSDDGYSGVRLAFMAPTQVEGSYGPASQPGRIIAADRHTATVRAANDAEQALSLQLIATLLPNEPGVELRWAMTNRSDRQRRLALWSIASFPRRGGALVPFDDAPQPFRTVTWFAWTPWPQPGVQLGRRAMTVNFEAPLRGAAMKVGVRSDRGWAVKLDGREALVSHVAYDVGGAYPEGGSNITVFQMRSDQRTWCETEQVGPLQAVDADAMITMTERLRLVTLRADPRPADAPDRLLAQLLKHFKPAPAPDASTRR